MLQLLENEEKFVPQVCEDNSDKYLFHGIEYQVIPDEDSYCVHLPMTDEDEFDGISQLSSPTEKTVGFILFALNEEEETIIDTQKILYDSKPEWSFYYYDRKNYLLIEIESDVETMVYKITDNKITSILKTKYWMDLRGKLTATNYKVEEYIFGKVFIEDRICKVWSYIDREEFDYSHPVFGTAFVRLYLICELLLKKILPRCLRLVIFSQVWEDKFLELLKK